MEMFNGYIMSKDIPVAKITNNRVEILNEKLCPLCIARRKDFVGWLSSRAIDSHRTHSRLLKKVLRLKEYSDFETVLKFNAATITDTYWVLPETSDLTYKDVRYEENKFDLLALEGDSNAFSLPPSKTPELTNVGSFEKCWKRENNEWWLYKSGNEYEYFSELFICRLAESLNLPVAHYEYDGKYIKTKDFTGNAKVNLEPMWAIMGDNEDYNDTFNVLYDMNIKLVEQYLQLIWFDTICFNRDRHTSNFGFLRDPDTGEILSLAPNYDNNIALISDGIKSERSLLTKFLKEFLDENKKAKELLRNMCLPNITETLLNDILSNMPISIDDEFVKRFILNSQKDVNDVLWDNGEQPGFRQTL